MSTCHRVILKLRSNQRRKHHPDSDDHQACGQKAGTGGNWVQECQNFTAFARITS